MNVTYDSVTLDKVDCIDGVLVKIWTSARVADSNPTQDNSLCDTQFVVLSLNVICLLRAEYKMKKIVPHGPKEYYYFMYKDNKKKIKCISYYSPRLDEVFTSVVYVS